MKDLTKTKNLHSNFKNLNPTYDLNRFKRAQDLANHWLDRLGDKLKQKVRDEKRKNFVEYIQSGNKLTFSEIQ